MARLVQKRGDIRDTEAGFSAQDVAPENKSPSIVSTLKNKVSGFMNRNDFKRDRPQSSISDLIPVNEPVQKIPQPVILPVQNTPSSPLPQVLPLPVSVSTTNPSVPINQTPVAIIPVNIPISNPVNTPPASQVVVPVTTPQSNLTTSAPQYDTRPTPNFPSTQKEDALALKGGFTKSAKDLQMAKWSIDQKVHNKEIEKENYSRTIDEYSVIVNNHNAKLRHYDSISRDPRYKQEAEKLGKEIADDGLNYIKAQAFLRSSTQGLINLNRDLDNLTMKKAKIESDVGDYNLAFQKGKERYLQENTFRNKAAKVAAPIYEATSDMISVPKIGDISKTVGFGGMDATSVSEGFKDLIGTVKVNSGANEWTKTRAGDRGFVEAIVNVRPNRNITPFGVSGTIGNSNLVNQFEYKTPLRRIGVGDVTARGGYQINIEDIHRKKKKDNPGIKRQPVSKLVEKKVKKNTIMSTIESLNKIGKIQSITSKPKKESITIKGNLSLKEFKSTGKFSLTDKTINPLKFNISGFTSNQVESNLNSLAKYVKKKKIAKVKS